MTEPLTDASERIQVIIEAAEKAAAGIIEDAEAQARKYLDESRRRADQLADQRVRSIGDLTDAMVQQAEVIKRESDELIVALDRAKNEIENTAADQFPGPIAGTAGVSGAAEASIRDDAGFPRLAPVDAPTEVEPTESDAAPTESDSAPADGDAPSAESDAAPSEAADPAEPDSRRLGESVGSDSQDGAEISDGARLLATQMAVAGSTREAIEGHLQNEFGIDNPKSVLDSILGPEN